MDPYYSLLQEIDQMIENSLTPLAQKIAEERADPGILDAQAQIEKIEKELRNSIQAARQQCQDGLKYCLKAAQRLAASDPSIDPENLREDFRAAFENFFPVQSAEALGKKAAEGYPWSTLLKISPQSLSTLYKGAKHLFESGRYNEAKDAFFFLTTLDVSSYSNWLGLGHSHFHLGNYELAIEAYEAAIQRDARQIWPYLYLASCHEKTQNFVKALEVLEKVQSLFHESGQKDEELLEALDDKIVELKNRI